MPAWATSWARPSLPIGSWMPSNKWSRPISISASTAKDSSIPIAGSASPLSRRSSMPLIKQGRIASDPFQPVADGAALPGEGPILIGLARWQEERGLIEPRNTAIGVRLKPAEAVDQLAGDLDRLALVVLEFPKFNDGRAFSQARLLRQRYGYKGEIRA